MHGKKIVGFFSVLFLLLGFMCSVDAWPDTTVSFRGGGVTVDLSFPEEAHPTDYIWHNATLTANTGLTLLNLTLIIRAPVGSTWQEITGWYLPNRVLQENESRKEEMYFQLPSNPNGTLQCFIYINTNQSAYYSSYMFYTTRVSELTSSEMQSLYYEMLANYTILQANYTTKLNEYNALLDNYTSLFANYTELLSERNELLDKYNAQVATSETLLAQYNKLSGDYNTLDSNYRSQLNKYNALEADYDSLNSTFYSAQGNYTFLQGNFTELQAVYDELNETYNDLLSENSKLQGTAGIDQIVMFIFIVTVACLIAFIIYIKRKQPEPYVVIRKETVAMKPDEKT